MIVSFYILFRLWYRISKDVRNHHQLKWTVNHDPALCWNTSKTSEDGATHYLEMYKWQMIKTGSLIMTVTWTKTRILNHKNGFKYHYLAISFMKSILNSIWFIDSCTSTLLATLGKPFCNYEVQDCQDPDVKSSLDATHSYLLMPDVFKLAKSNL